MIDNKILNIWLQLAQANGALKRRALRNLGLYAPLSPYDFHNPATVKVLQENGIELDMLNFTNQFVQAWAGFLIQHKTSPVWTDRENDKVETSSVIQGLSTAFDSDRHLYSYDKEFDDFIINSLVFMGVMELKIDKNESNPFGRILLKNHPIGTVWFDPSVTGTDIAKESRYAVTEYHMSTNEMIYQFPKKKKEIEQHEIDYQAVDTTSSHQIPDAHNMKGSKYPVVELNYIERENKPATYSSKGFKVPDSEHKFGSQEDVEFKQNFLKTKGFEDSEMKTIYLKKEKLMLCTFCPHLNLELQNKKDQRQIMENGRIRLPFYTMSFETINGIPLGIPDIAAKCQKDINETEAKKSYVFTTTRWGGKDIIHPEAWGNDSSYKSQVLNNDPASPMVLHPRAPINAKLIDHIPAPNINPQIFQDQGFKKESLKEIVRLNEAILGQYGKSEESSLLHDRKVEEGTSMNAVNIQMLRSVFKDVFKGYFQVSLITYKGNTDDEFVANMNRKFRSPDGKNVTLNEFQGMDEKGQPIIGNDLSKINPENIITTLDTTNSTSKARKREVNSALLTGIPESEYNQVFKLILLGDIVKNLDETTPEQKEKLEQAIGLGINLAMSRLVTSTRASELDLANIEAQFAQLQTVQQNGGVPPGEQPTNEQNNNKQAPVANTLGG